ncbi:hypothetical protein ACIOMM_36710 [Streptomyces sp. NPDC087908]|uniref:hypothetical protein n=1 Tax=Streptomyces sp. NPDC087908 TaxID=3365820 RepID=UPI00382F8763
MNLTGMTGRPATVVAALPLHDATVNHLIQDGKVLELAVELCAWPSDDLSLPRYQGSGMLRFLRVKWVGGNLPWQPFWREPEWGIEVLMGRTSAERQDHVELTLEVQKYGSDEREIVTLHVAADEAEWVPDSAVTSG